MDLLHIPSWSSFAGLQPAAVSSATGFSRWVRLQTAVSRLQPGFSTNRAKARLKPVARGKAAG